MDMPRHGRECRSDGNVAVKLRQPERDCHGSEGCTEKKKWPETIGKNGKRPCAKNGAFHFEHFPSRKLNLRSQSFKACEGCLIQRNKF
ncbi:MAG: hypothetical protein AB1342_10110 [Pseudomonadota bacterium]